MCDSGASGYHSPNWSLGKCPPDPFERQPCRDMRVFVDKAVVVVIEESVTKRLAVNEPDRHD